MTTPDSTEAHHARRRTTDGGRDVLMSPRERARALVLQHGDAATAYQILNPGIQYWFQNDPQAVVGYVRRFGVRIAAGPPICPPAYRQEAMRTFTSDAARSGDRVAWALIPASLAQRGRLWIGAQPWWTPQGFLDAIQSKASLRAQVARATNKGVQVRRWTADLGTDCLRRCLAAWLATKGLPAMHFLVEPNTLSHLADRIVMIAEHHHRVIGFCILSPIARNNAWLVEQQVRIPCAPNGTGELLLYASAQELTTRCADAMTLGLSPLSRRCGLIPESSEWWQRWLIGWARAHGRRFYDADRLDAFKAKFRPQWWESLYIAGHPSRLHPHVVFAAAAAFAGRSPISFVFQALIKALRQELWWMRRKKRGPATIPSIMRQS